MGVASCHVLIPAGPSRTFEQNLLREPTSGMFAPSPMSAFPKSTIHVTPAFAQSMRHYVQKANRA